MSALCLLLLLPSVASAIELHVPDAPAIGLLGEDVVLPCWFSPPPGFSLRELSLFWKLTTFQQVHAFSLGQEQLENQDPDFINRTLLFPEELSVGNMSLLLRGVRLSDEGVYTCFVNVENSSSAAVRLQVAAPFSKPVLHLEPSESLKPGDKVTMTCHTYHGYPEVELVWQDGKGHNLTENVTTSQVANEKGLFHVQSTVVVTLETSDTYTCLVYHPVLRDVTQSSVTVTALWVTVGLCVCLLGLLVALACVCRKQLKQTCEEEQAEAGDEEVEENGELKTAMQPLKASSAGDDDNTLCIE